MGPKGILGCLWLVLICNCLAASIDWAIGTSIPSATSRFAVDSEGNILIAASDSGACALPTVNPLSTCGPIWIGKLDASGQTLLFATYIGKPEPGSFTAVAGIAADPTGNVILVAAVPSNVYVAKLAADGSQLLYEIYLGGQSALSLAVDSAGGAYVAGTTQSPSSAIVVKLGAAGVLQYSVTFPFPFSTDVKPIQVDASGRAILVSNAQMVTVAADGSSVTRALLPAWTVASGVCTADPSGIVGCPGNPWVLPLPGGGYQLAGTAGAGIPGTADALQLYTAANSYVRIENGHSAAQLTAPVSGITVDPRNRARIYAATASGLLLSVDNGLNWSVLREGPALAIAVDPFDSNRLYLSAEAGPHLYRSTDAGATWATLDIGQSARIMSLAADPNVPGLLYAAGGALFRSRDGGDTWDARQVGPSRQDMSPSASTSTSSISVQVDPTHAGWAYVVGRTACIGFCPVTQALSRTQDGGHTWTAATSGLDPLVSVFTAASLAVEPTTGDVIESVAGAGSGAEAIAYRNGDFTTPQVLYPAQTTAIAFDPDQPGTIYLAVHIAQGPGSGYFVIESMDGGTTWTTVIQLDRPVNSLAVSAGGVLHASQTPNVPEGYLVSADASFNAQYGTWLGGAFTQVNAVAASAGWVFVAGKTQGGLSLMDAAQPALGGGTDGFVAAFNDAGSLAWSTYLGGSADDSIDWVLPLPDGSAVVVGTTSSTDFPSVQPSPLGAGSTFIARSTPSSYSGRGRGRFPGNR